MTRLLVALCAVACPSCISADAWLTASDIEYPISLTGSIIDEQGNVYQPSAVELHGQFKRSWRQWQWFDWDLNQVSLGAVLEKEIERQGGDGVVNLRVRVVNSIEYVTAALMIFPTSIRVTVEGDVIRRTSRTSR